MKIDASKWAVGKVIYSYQKSGAIRKYQGSHVFFTLSYGNVSYLFSCIPSTRSLMIENGGYRAVAMERTWYSRTLNNSIPTLGNEIQGT